MARVKSRKIGYIINLLTGIIIGAISGVAILSAITCHRIDVLYERIAALENTILDKNAKLENLEKSINSKKFVLKDIEVMLLFEKDSLDELETMHIKKTVKEKYSVLLGSEVKSIDPELIVLIIDNRILKMNGKEFRLRVNRLILTETLKLWIDVGMIE
ncbi:MAG TPA: hypothetical protein GXX26_05400 [Clostridiaceae bacterium]|jgi:hypothetical protein|nr:hypothetical protein [Clostridiaceae bacterium]